MRMLRKIFAILIAAPLFVFLAYVFGVFLNPQGQAGWVAAIVLIGVSAIVSLIVYGWIMRGARVPPMNKGHDDGRGVGLGLLGASAAGRRRRDEHDGDDFGSRRRDAADSNDSDGDSDGAGLGNLG